MIPLNADALAALKEWRARWPDAKPGDFIFPSEKLKFKGEGSVERGQMTSYGVDRTKPLASWKTAWRTAKRAGRRRMPNARCSPRIRVQVRGKRNPGIGH